MHIATILAEQVADQLVQGTRYGSGWRLTPTKRGQRVLDKNERYTDVAQLPILQETARLPSFQVPKAAETKRRQTYSGRMRNLVSNSPVSLSNDSQLNAQRDAQTGVPQSPEQSLAGTIDQKTIITELARSEGIGTKKRPVANRAF